MSGMNVFHGALIVTPIYPHKGKTSMVSDVFS